VSIKNGGTTNRLLINSFDYTRRFTDNSSIHLVLITSGPYANFFLALIRK